MQQEEPHTATDRAGFHSIAEWCRAAGISRATYYQLPAEAKPAHVGIGHRVVISETPAAWLARAQQGGGIVTIKRPRKSKRAPETRAPRAA